MLPCFIVIARKISKLNIRIDVLRCGELVKCDHIERTKFHSIGREGFAGSFIQFAFIPHEYSGRRILIRLQFFLVYGSPAFDIFHSRSRLKNENMSPSPIGISGCADDDRIANILQLGVLSPKNELTAKEE